MARCQNCGKYEANERLFFLVYEEPAPASDNPFNSGLAKGETQPIGAVKYAVCPNCLAKAAWRGVFGALWVFIAGSVAISYLSWLISRLFNLVWVGGVALIGLLFIYFIKSVVREVKASGNTVVLSAARRLLKSRPLGDNSFVTLSDYGKAALEDNGLALISPESFKSGRLKLYTKDEVDKMTGSVSSLMPEEKETLQTFVAAAEAAYTAPPEARLPSVGRCFWRPVVGGLNILTALLVTVLFIDETMYSGKVLTLLIAIIAGIAGIGGGVLLTVWVKKLGYAALALMLALLWGFALINGSALLISDSIIISVIVAIPALAYIPFINTKRRCL